MVMGTAELTRRVGTRTDCGQDLEAPLSPTEQDMQNLGPHWRFVMSPAVEQRPANLRIVDLLQSVQGSLLQWRRELRPQNSTEAGDILPLRSWFAAKQSDGQQTVRFGRGCQLRSLAGVIEQPSQFAAGLLQR